MSEARLAQSVERKALNLVVVGSSPTVGVFLFFFFFAFALLISVSVFAPTVSHLIHLHNLLHW